MTWKVLDFAYYCIYSFMMRSRDRAAADVWPVALIPVIVVMHLMVLYWTIALLVDLDPRFIITNDKAIGLSASGVLAAILFWFYVYRNRGDKVVRRYKKLQRDRFYARIGQLLFIEACLMPFVFPVVVVLFKSL